MNATQPVRHHRNPTGKHARGELRVTAESRAVRRRLGPLPWAVLEELALAARPREDSWLAPLGVRAIGTALGVTKDTAARAVATLRSAGIVTQVRVRTSDGRSVPAYLLQLPDGIAVQRRTSSQDTHGNGANGVSASRNRDVPGRQRKSQLMRSESPVQVSLFDYPVSPAR